ncbi:hypothetical protein OG943_16140 [Amycolatopsis sp. NBC_00345]
MSTVTSAAPAAATAGPFRSDRRRLRGAAVVRIGYGVVWAIDASFK